MIFPCQRVLYRRPTTLASWVIKIILVAEIVTIVYDIDMECKLINASRNQICEVRHILRRQAQMEKTFKKPENRKTRSSRADRALSAPTRNSSTLGLQIGQTLVLSSGILLGLIAIYWAVRKPGADYFLAVSFGAVSALMVVCATALQLLFSRTRRRNR